VLKSLLRERLLHFLLLGAALFALDGWFRPLAAPAASAQIVVSEALIQNLRSSFARAWQRPPTREELDGLIESHIREEVLVREALALGLDRDDAVIRKRLQQKLEFVSEQASALVPPTEAQLEAYLKEHPEAFRLPPRASFAQIYLDPARRKGALPADAAKLLEVLNRAGGPRDLAEVGDRLMLLEPRYENMAQPEVASQFGTEFAEALVRQSPGRWVGPLASGFGFHLVRIESLQPGGTPPLAQVRPLVEREWANARREATAREVYAKLRGKYTISVQWPGAAGASGAPSAPGSPGSKGVPSAPVSPAGVRP